MGAFLFKQFKVEQDFSAMKVNTDAVLLGAWLHLPQNEDGQQTLRALDIGTGTGVIALMAGQRFAQNGTNAEIVAVEIDENACKDALRNFNDAPWGGVSFFLKNESLQEFAKNYREKFNLIFSNPPYFIDSLKNNDNSKSVARHTDTLTQREILFYGAQLLKEDGLLALVLPVTEGEEFLRKVEFLKNNTPAGEYFFTHRRVCRVHTVERKPAKRILIELKLVKQLPQGEQAKKEPFVEERLIMLSNGANTEQYSNLVGDFYL